MFRHRLLRPLLIPRLAPLLVPPLRLRAAFIPGMLAASLCALTACGSIPQQNTETREAASRHTQALMQDTSLAPLWRKTTLVPNEATPEMLADPARVTAAEKPLLRELARKSAEYQEEMVALFHAHQLAPALITLWEEGAAAGAVLRAQLHNGELTWAEYNTRLRELHTTQRMALAEAQDVLAGRSAMSPQPAKAQLAQTRMYAQATYASTLAQPGQASAKAGAKSASCEVIGQAQYCE